MNDNGLYLDKPRLRNSSFRSFSVTAGAVTQIAGASSKRVRVTIRTDGSGILNVSQQNPIDAARTIPVATQYAELVLDTKFYGTLVQNPLFAQAAAGTIVVGVIEAVED